MCERCDLMKRVKPEVADQIQHDIIQNYVLAGGRPIDIHTVIGIGQAAYMAFLSLSHKDGIQHKSQEELDTAADNKETQIAFLKVLALYFSATETVPGSTTLGKITPPS